MRLKNSGFYEDDFEVEDEKRALFWCREFSIHRRLRSYEEERRAFYRYVCKRGMYDQMVLKYMVHGEPYMYRWAGNWRHGYPSFNAPRSGVRDRWHRRQNILYGQAMYRRADREKQKQDILDRFREARVQITHHAYRYYFSGIGRENVGWSVLFLATSLMRLKEVIKHKNST